MHIDWWFRWRQWRVFWVWACHRATQLAGHWVRPTSPLQNNMTSRTQNKHTQATHKVPRSLHIFMQGLRCMLLVHNSWRILYKSANISECLWPSAAVHTSMTSMVLDKWAVMSQLHEQDASRPSHDGAAACGYTCTVLTLDIASCFTQGTGVAFDAGRPFELIF